MYETGEIEGYKSDVLLACMRDINKDVSDIHDFELDELERFIELVTKQEDRRGSGPLKAGDKCPKCGTGTMKERSGSRGAFLGCTQYPKCRNTCDVPEE